VNVSELDFSVTEGKIRFGLAAVKNVGEAAIEAVLAARGDGGAFKDLFDFCSRVDLRKVNKRVLEGLIKCGAFDSTGGRRAQLAASLEKATDLAQSSQRDRAVGQHSLFGGMSASAAPKFAYVETPDWDETTRLKAERESVGFYVSGHPLLKYSRILRRYANADTARLSEMRDQSTARIGGMVSTLKEITTRKGDRMAFVTVEDLLGRVEVVVFSDVYRAQSEIFKGEDPIFLVGKVDVAEEQPKIIVTQVSRLEDAHKLFTGTVHVSADATHLSEVTLKELKAVFGRYKGECPMVLHLKIPGKSETVLSLSRDYAVAPSNELIEEITTLLGSASEIHFA
jgi:DNA polymerase-3 subunit alpha